MNIVRGRYSVRASVVCRARVGAAVSAGVPLSIIAASRARLLVGSGVASLLLGALATVLAAAAAVSLKGPNVVTGPLSRAASFVGSGAIAFIVWDSLRRVANACGEHGVCRGADPHSFVGSGGAVPEPPSFVLNKIVEGCRRHINSLSSLEKFY